MKKMLIGAIVVVSVLAIVALQSSQIVWSKAHVPTGKVQVCHKAKTITVAQNALSAHLRHGDGRLPACDFNNVFHTGEPCPTEVDGNGNAILPNERDDACGVTPACPAGPACY